MSARFYDSFLWCTFAGLPFKYTQGAGFQGTGSQTLTGGIDPGPFAADGVRFDVANCSVPNFFGNFGYELDANLGAGADSWVASVWIKPHAISSRQTFYALKDQEVPNFNAKMALHINAANKLEIDFQQAPLRMNTLFGTQHVTSLSTIAMDTWTHICVLVNFLGGSAGNVTLWINGALDIFAGGFNLLTGSKVQTITLCWQNPSAGPEIVMSLPIVFDRLGTTNNTQIRPSTQITPYFPASDVANGSWVPSTGVLNYAMVNGLLNAPGGNNISLPSLISADELFGIASLGTADPNLALAVNIVSIQNVSETFQALMKQGATKYLLGSALTASTVQGNQQVIVETNPATGLVWKDADISANAWGLRGLTGTGEQVFQLYLEKLWQSGIGSYSYSK